MLARRCPLTRQAINGSCERPGGFWDPVQPPKVSPMSVTSVTFPILPLSEKSMILKGTKELSSPSFSGRRPDHNGMLGFLCTRRDDPELETRRKWTSFTAYRITYWALHPGGRDAGNEPG